MNLSTAIFLINPDVRSVKVSYEPDVKGNPCQLFKTLDKSVKVGDIVVVPTDTRHKMTCCKVEAVDFGVDFETSTEYRWVIARVDTVRWEKVQDEESRVMGTVREAEENRKRHELAASLKLHKLDFSGLSIAGPQEAPAAQASFRPEEPDTF